MFSTDLSPLSRTELMSSRSPFGNSPEDRRSRAPAHPRGFRPIRGVASEVRFGGMERRNKGSTYSQKLGLAYEEKVHDVLSAIYGNAYRASPSILFSDRRGLRQAIPDGLLRLGARYVLIEIKLTHTEKAWWQLQRLYLPLISTLVLRGAYIQCFEICRSYDPAVQFPAPHKLVTSLHEVLPREVTGVVQWKL